VLTTLLEEHIAFHGVPSQPEQVRQFLLDRIRYNQSFLFLALTPDEHAVGFAQIYPIFTSLGLAQVYILNDMYVVEGSRGLGVGTALLKAVQDFAKGCGVAKLRLTTTVDNVFAQRVYEKAGWKQTNEYLLYEYTTSDL